MPECSILCLYIFVIIVVWISPSSIITNVSGISRDIKKPDIILLMWLWFWQLTVGMAQMESRWSTMVILSLPKFSSEMWWRPSTSMPSWKTSKYSNTQELSSTPSPGSSAQVKAATEKQALFLGPPFLHSYCPGSLPSPQQRLGTSTMASKFMDSWDPLVPILSHPVSLKISKQGMTSKFF